jgi:hypothetical protein
MTIQPNTLIHCEAFYDTDTNRIVIHVPEELRPKQTDDHPTQPRRRGRPSIYSSDEERKAKHREQALRHYYRKKALQEQQNSHSDDEVRLTISTHSKTLGDISEDITFKRVNGRLRKQH